MFANSYWEWMAISRHEDIRTGSVGSADSREIEVGGLLCTDELLSDFSNPVGVELNR